MRGFAAKTNIKKRRKKRVVIVPSSSPVIYLFFFFSCSEYKKRSLNIIAQARKRRTKVNFLFLTFFSTLLLRFTQLNRIRVIKSISLPLVLRSLDSFFYA